MEKINRPDAPSWLAENWQQWGEDWEEKRQTSIKTPRFYWRRKADLVEKLSTMTQYHCSFCDSYPMQSTIKETIEHFRPKSKFPLLAYQWENLFICCSICQEKGDKFDELLLKPDDQDHDFDTYFDIDWITGELEPSITATPEQQARADCTIRLYKLNEGGRPAARMTELEKFSSSSLDDLDKWSYRYFLSRGT